MPHAALELNDASLAIADPGGVVLAGPAYAAEAGGALVFGAEARARAWSKPRSAQRRFWATLDESALPQPLAGCATAADLAEQQLRRLWSLCAGCDAAVLVPHPAWSAAQVGLLLGIARDAGVPVAGIVDAAVAAIRRPYPGRVAWQLQPTLEATWLTRIGQEGGSANVDARDSLPRAGTEALERGCAEFLARHFVERSRFDPLHDADSEQQLYDRMPEWLLAAGRAEALELVLEHRGNRFVAPLETALLRARVARLVEPLLQRLRALASPREPAVLLVHQRFADFPGLVEALACLPGCVVVLLEAGAAARGALRLPPAAAGEGLRLVTRLPFDQPPDDLALAVAVAPARAPTHVMYDGRAWRLADGAVQVGTALEDGEFGIRLGSGAQGVSRRHCAIVLEDGRAMVHDQSRYGTFLNGHRIEGSAALQAGDVLTVGQPPRELRLIAEVGRGS